MSKQEMKERKIKLWIAWEFTLASIAGILDGRSSSLEITQSTWDDEKKKKKIFTMCLWYLKVKQRKNVSRAKENFEIVSLSARRLRCASLLHTYVEFHSIECKRFPLRWREKNVPCELFCISYDFPSFSFVKIIRLSPNFDKQQL